METVVLFKAPDGAKFLRGLAGVPSDTDLTTRAARLGAVAWTTLGTMDGIGAKVTEVDYRPDGTVASRATRKIAEFCGTCGAALEIGLYGDYHSCGECYGGSDE